MKNAIYARQSLFKQDSVSIEAQIDQCKHCIPTNEEYEIYYDKGWSGKNVQRPEMQRLLNDIKTGNVSRVISYRLDRISRNIVDFGNLLQLFEQHGVCYVSATEPFDTSTPIGRAMIYIVATFADLERSTIALRVLDNYKFRASSGVSFMGGNLPYGYDNKRVLIDGKMKPNLFINEEDSKTVKYIFEKFTKGNSIYSIIKELNNSNIERKFSPIAIKRILSNPIYVASDENIFLYLLAKGYNLINQQKDFDGINGLCIYMKNANKNQLTPIDQQIVVIGNHEPIIDSGTWIKAQYMIQRNKMIPTLTKRSKVSIFAGLIKCKECNGSFGLKVSKEYKYYLCRQRYSKGGLCNNTYSIRQEKFELEIIPQILDYINSLDIKKHEVDNTILLKIEIIDKEVNNYIENIGKGNTTVDGLLIKKIEELQKQKEELQKENDSMVESSAIKVNHEEFANFNFEDKVNFIRQAVDKITVDKEGEVEIYYKI